MVIKADPNKVQPWYFTFGGGHAHPQGYVRIEGTFDEARQEMFEKWGVKWAFQYNEQEFLPQIQRFNLYDVDSELGTNVKPS